MVTFRIKTDVKDDRRVVLTLPRDVPTGVTELVVSVERPAVANGDFEQRFETLAKEWKSQRGCSSSITRMAMQYAYQQIIGLGERAIPLLLRELEREPDHWFWALKVLTGVNPVPPEQRANIQEMAKYWLRWGKEQGYRW
jgi:hypothetical protein